jgi:PHP family Zn ribbon phosphoesterase
MNTRSEKGTSAETRNALMQALRRVEANRPTEDRNITAAKKGKLRVTIATVAREANRSRTLIGSGNCPYPDVRKAILDIIGGVRDVGERRINASELVDVLRTDKAALEHHLRVLSTRLTDAMLLVEELRKKCTTLESERDGARRSMVRSTKVVVKDPI